MIILEFKVLFSIYNMYCVQPVWREYHDTVLSALGNNVLQFLIPQKFKIAYIIREKPVYKLQQLHHPWIHAGCPAETWALTHHVYMFRLSF